MIVLIAGSSHTGKTLFAQKLNVLVQNIVLSNLANRNTISDKTEINYNLKE